MEEKEKQGIGQDLHMEIKRLFHGSIIYPQNFTVYPLSPTRIMVCFAPYFRAFFPIMDSMNLIELYPPLLKKEQFNQHFFEPMRMELFRPCKSFNNRFYQYSVKELTAKETQSLNSMLLDMETEEFVFHDFNKIRDSFWYYEHKATFADEKKHDFSRII